MDLGWIAAIALSLAVLWAALLVLFWLLRPKGVPAREILRLVPDILRLLRSVITDRSAPPDVRLVLVGLLVWIVSPIDLIPEFMPGIGPLDDIIVAVVALRYTRRRLGVAELRGRWPGSADGFELLLRMVGTDSPPAGPRGHAT
jgi:uncharacterized membrane protein YkvA (DUF1232 family)